MVHIHLYAGVHLPRRVQTVKLLNEDAAKSIRDFHAAKKPIG